MLSKWLILKRKTWRIGFHFSMKKNDKIEKANTLGRVINLLSKRQLNMFCAVIAWYQIHNKMSYYLAERSRRRLFIDLMFKKVMKKGKIEDRRWEVINHLEDTVKPTMREELIKLGKACAKNVPIRELNEMAKNARGRV